MPRTAGYEPSDYKKAVALFNEGKTAKAIEEATSLTAGQVNGIKRKAAENGDLKIEIKKRAPRGSGKSKSVAKKDPRVFGGTGPNLSFFFDKVKPTEETPSENEQLLELMEELRDIEEKLSRSEQTTKALSLARAWWNTRIDLVKAGEQDPGVVPVEGWTPEQVTAAAPPKKKAGKK